MTIHRHFRDHSWLDHLCVLHGELSAMLKDKVELHANGVSKIDLREEINDLEQEIIGELLNQAIFLTK